MRRFPGFVQVLFAPDGPGGASSGSPSGGSSDSSSGGSGGQSSGSAPPSPAAPSTPSGASSAPSSTPTPASEGTVAPGVAGRPSTSHDDLGGAEPDSLLDDLLSTISGGGQEVEVLAQPGAAPPPPTPVAAPGAQPAAGAPAAPQPTPAPAPAQPAAAQPSGQQSPQETRPLLSPADPLGLANALATQEAAAVVEVAKTFQFTPEEVEALGLEPQAAPALAQIMAKTQVRTVQEVLRTIAKVVPAMFQGMNAVQASVTESKNLFFQRWPDIPRDKAADIDRVARVYRQNNPNIPREQMIEEVGQMIMVMHKIQPRQAAPAPVVHGQPIAVRGPTNGVQPPSVFTPAVSGVAGSPQQGGSGGEWDWLDPNYQR